MYLNITRCNAGNIQASSKFSTTGHIDIDPCPIRAGVTAAYDNNVVSTTLNTTSTGYLLKCEVGDGNIACRVPVQVASIIVLFDEDAVSADDVSVTLA
jgi:hypothetical protein